MSILDEYEDDTFVSYSPVNQRKVKQADLGPIFKKHKIDLNVEDAITNLLVSNNLLFVHLANRKLVRMDLMTGENESFDLAKVLGARSDFATLSSMFLSPNGRHCILSYQFSDASSSENIYFCRSRFTVLRLKGHVITSVAWNHRHEGTSSGRFSTSNILIGTSKGLIFEAEITSPENEAKWPLMTAFSVDQQLRQIYDFSKQMPSDVDSGPITGIEFHLVQLNTFSGYCCFVIVTTNTQIYQFVGKSDELPENVDSISQTNSYPWAEIFSDFELKEFPGNLGFSKLDCFYDRNEVPSSLAWLIEPGIFFGKLDLRLIKMKGKVIENNKMIPYRDPTANSKPLSLVLTKYHVLVLFKDLLKIICIVNNQIIMEDKFLPSYGQAVGITKDIVKGTVWAYSERAIYRYKINEEDRNIIDIYLSKNDFENARICANQNKFKLDLINCRQAQYLYDNKKYMESAHLFARSSQPFEEIALKFLNLGDDSLLKEYLIHKLDSLGQGDYTQTTLLIVWIIELIIKNVKDERDPMDDRYQILKIEFQSILSNDKIKANVVRSKKAIYDLLIANANDEFLIYFARLMNDHHFAINHYLDAKQYKEALKMLEEKQNADLLYEFGPYVFRELPVELVDLLIHSYSKLDYSRLLPSIICPKREISNNKEDDVGEQVHYQQLIRLLEHSVHLTKEQIVYNYLLAIYAEMCPEKLVSFCDDDNAFPPEFDLKYALSICEEHSLSKACVRLYTIMGLYDEAVDNALLLDVEWAKMIAERPEIGEEMKRRLWLKIARHLVSQSDHQEIIKVNDLLAQCHLLHIEDLLPFFPEVHSMEHLKQPICRSLQSYSTQIDSIKEEMNEVTESTEQIRTTLRQLNNAFRIIRISDKCFVCHKEIMSEEFFSFPCGHLFHSCCLEQVVLKLAPSKLINELQSLKSQLNLLQKQLLTSSLDGTNREKIKARDSIKQQFDDLLSAECPHCDELMIQAIDRPFLFDSGEQDGWD